MVKFGFTYDPSISLEQRVGFELAAMIWSSYLTDEVTINLHIGSSSSLGEEGQAVGGAIPIFHEQHYGIYQEYLEADATSDIDESAVEHLQAGNTVDFLVNGQLVDGNTNILLTSAQAKALGMDEALTLDNGGTWDRDLVDDNALDGYILVSNAFEWNYDYTRSGDAPEGTLDFMSMALHEIGHQLGFVSGLDGSLDLTHLHSGETQATGFTALDLFRHSLESGEILNPDGAVSDLSVGQSSYFSVDGGETNLGDFSDGVDYQASHWSRLQVAMGIMDPTLAYQERTSLGLLDLQAMDALGWDVNYSAIRTGLDIDSLLLQAEQAVAEDLGIASSLLTDNRGQEEDSNFYTLGYGELWQLFEKSMLALGYGELWQAFELGYGELWQEYGRRILNLGYGELWQLIEENIFKLGYGELWQKFETEMLELGYGELWQKFETEMLELGYGELWQKLDEFFAKVDKESSDSSQTEKIADGGVGGQVARIFRGGDADDIISGDKKQDRIKAGGGDDLIDGKGGHDVIWGEAGRDMIYGQDGNDLLYGGGDEDLILGETGDDKLHGEAGDDIASGGSGDDIVTGGEGKDDLKGGTGRDVLSGDEGHDRLDGEAGNDIVIGGKGRDQVSGGSGNDILYGDSYAGSETLKQLRRQLKRQPAEVNENTAVEAASSNNELNPIRVEAEDMNLSGDYAIRTNWGNDSGETLRVLSTATATTTFTGPSGNYMVVARYFDENENGDYAALNFNLNGSDLNQFILDQETGQFHTQTVAQNLVLNSGDVFTVTATVEGKDNASFDYLEFVSLDNLLVTQLESSSTESIVNIDNNTSDNTIVRVEAESMTLIGDYSANSFNTASNGQVIELSDQGHGKALTAFSGETGFYNVVVGYYDDNKDGIGQISALLDGVELDTWRLDQNLATSSANVENLTTRTVASGIALSKGDIFKLVGMRGESNVSDEATRIDYVEFIKVDTPTQSAVESGLVAHWSFDEAAGNTVTDSINGLSGTLHNMEDSDRNQGAVGQSINFDGVNEHGIVDSAEALTLGANNADFSVSFWLKLEEDSTGSWRKILHKGETNQDRTFGLWTQPNSNRIHYRISTTASWNEGGNSQKELTVNQWTHVSYVKEDNKLSLYLDGQLDSSVNLRGEVIGNDGPLRLGSTGLDASLDDLRLYDRALTQQDVSALNRMTTITPLESGLVAHWSFDEAAGNTVTDSINGLSGTLHNMEDSDRNQGAVGQSINFDGVNEHGIVDSAEALTLGTDNADFSVSFWLKVEADSTGSWRKILHRGETERDRNFGLWMHPNSNHLTYRVSTTASWNEGGSSQRELTLNQWTHVSYVKEDNKLSLYLDGQFESSVTLQGEVIGSSGPLRLGSTGLDASLDDLRLYDRALTQQDVSALNRMTTITPLESGLVAHWSFDEAAGNTITDSINGLSGTLHNMEDSDRNQGAVGQSINFDGVNEHGIVDSAEALTLGTDNADFSVSFWLKVEADSTGSWRKILHRGETERDRNFGLWMHPNSNHLTYRVSTTASWNEGGSSQRELTLNQWTHVSYVKEDNKLSLYLDGQFESSITLRGEVIGSSGPLRLGSTGLDASLDELRLYDRALTQQDVSVLSLSSILTTDTSSESDLIQGGAGDDVAFGGDGNDVIYGDTQTERFGESMSGAHVYKGHTYFLTQTASTWNEAQTEAQRLGGNLVTINSADEEAWLQRTFVNEKTWIGLTDRRAEGAFEWASSEAVTYTNWAPGEPNNSGDQDYATMNFGANRQWDDTTSAAFHRGVIEINSTDNDTLFGDAGNDTVYGQTGNDALYGDTLAAALSEGLITYLDFNEGTGSTSSSHTSTGTFVGGTSWTAGKLGNAVQLDGNSGRVLVQDSAELNITHQLTLSAWVKADQFTKWTGIITKGTNSAPYSLMIMDDGAIQFESNYGQADKGMWKSHGQLTANEWHHVAATYDGEALRFYIDGQLDSNVVYTDIDFAINNEDLIVGAQLPGGDEYFDGALDDVRVYNRALSNVEVNALATSDENSGSILNLAEDAIYHNGSYYLLSSNDLTWEEAQAQAESIGGNLVTINDAAEEAWLHTTFSASGELWIGLTDKSVEGQFEWASGEAVTYTNWSPNEPNDSGAGEDYAIFNRAGTQQWDDRGQPNQVYQGIIEIQGIGADNLEGGVGNDLLVGGLGNDVLNGTDAVAAGKVERDTMLGGKGADIFVLGNVEQAYYQGRGDQDYALIKDFSSAEGDKLQIHGSTSSYTQQQQGRDLYLYRQGTTSDLVAIFENTTTLDLSTVTLNS